MSHSDLLRRFPIGGSPRTGIVTGMLESTCLLHLYIAACEDIALNRDLRNAWLAESSDQIDCWIPTAGPTTCGAWIPGFKFIFGDVR